MRYMRLALALALLIFFTCPKNADAQISTLSTRTAIAPDTTIQALTNRIQALEALVAQLQEKLAFVKSVNPLVIDPGGDLTIQSANKITLTAGMGFSVRAGTAIELNSTTSTLIQAGGPLDLKGSSVRHNGGTFPIACAASTVNGQTAVGGGLRGGEHTHAVTLPVTTCSNSVGVPGPGQ